MTKSVLAKNLKTLRGFNGLNQDALANALGVSRNKIASYETQNIEPKLDLLAKISTLFGVAIDDLIGTEINKTNYKDVQAIYSAIQEGLQSKDTTESIPKFVLNSQAVDDFINKNVLIGKMVEGMKTFYDFKNKNSSLSPESQQLMYILDHLMAANKEFLAEIENVKIQQE